MGEGKSSGGGGLGERAASFSSSRFPSSPPHGGASGGGSEGELPQTFFRRRVKGGGAKGPLPRAVDGVRGACEELNWLFYLTTGSVGVGGRHTQFILIHFCLMIAIIILIFPLLGVFFFPSHTSAYFGGERFAPLYFILFYF